FFSILVCPPPSSTLFPYTTLFRSLIAAYLVGVRPFLTANWRYLAMLNFVVDPKIVAPLVPPGTEIDFENGETFLSVVGFLFQSQDRKSTRLNSSHVAISYAVFCLK